LALNPIRFDYEWLRALETETETVINAAAAIGYTREPLVYYKTWSAVDPIYATAAMDAIKNWNRVKANVQAAVDLFGLDDTVPAQFTPTAAVPGERITLVKLQQMVDALASVGDRIAAIIEHQTLFGPWAGGQYAGGGPTL
jgi:hypothetical protein